MYIYSISTDHAKYWVVIIILVMILYVLILEISVLFEEYQCITLYNYFYYYIFLNINLNVLNTSDTWKINHRMHKNLKVRFETFNFIYIHIISHTLYTYIKHSKLGIIF